IAPVRGCCPGQTSRDKYSSCPVDFPGARGHGVWDLRYHPDFPVVLAKSFRLGWPQPYQKIYWSGQLRRAFPGGTVLDFTQKQPLLAGFVSAWPRHRAGNRDSAESENPCDADCEVALLFSIRAVRGSRRLGFFLVLRAFPWPSECGPGDIWPAI